MPSCHFEACPFVPIQRRLQLNGASTVDIRLSTSFATVTTIALHDGDMRKPIAKKVVPTTGVTDATMSFVDLKPSESLSCEVRVDAELGAARVQVRVDY